MENWIQNQDSFYVTKDDQKIYFSDDFIIQDMAALRKPCDKLEVVTSNEDWPFPTYGKLLFGIL